MRREGFMEEGSVIPPTRRSNWALLLLPDPPYKKRSGRPRALCVNPPPTSDFAPSPHSENLVAQTRASYAPRGACGTVCRNGDLDGPGEAAGRLALRAAAAPELPEPPEPCLHCLS